MDSYNCKQIPVLNTRLSFVTIEIFLCGKYIFSLQFLTKNFAKIDYICKFHSSPINISKIIKSNEEMFQDYLQIQFKKNYD